MKQKIIMTQKECSRLVKLLEEIKKEYGNVFSEIMIEKLNKKIAYFQFRINDNDALALVSCPVCNSKKILQFNLSVIDEIIYFCKKCECHFQTSQD